jgi:hypothetical protein
VANLAGERVQHYLIIVAVTPDQIGISGSRALDLVDVTELVFNHIASSLAADHLARTQAVGLLILPDIF